MKLSRTTPCQRFDIFAPRYRDRKVLLAKHKVGANNEIRFTKAKSLPDVYYVSGEVVKASPVESNGTIDCYAVDMGELELLERD